MDVVVVDNDSRDEVCDKARDQWPLVSFVRAPRNLGYGGGMNLGFRSAPVQPDHLLFITHEVLLSEGSLAALTDALSRPEIALVGPVLRLPNGNVWSYGGLIGWRGNAFHSTKPLAGVRWLDGASIATTRHMFERLKGFDESFFLYWEDVDISLRASYYGEIEVLETATAQQNTGLTPEHWKISGAIVLWRKHKSPVLVLATICAALGRAAATVVRRPRQAISISRLTLRSISHGLRARLKVTTLEGTLLQDDS